MACSTSGAHRGEVRAGLRLGHLMAVEEYRLPVWRADRIRHRRARDSKGRDLGRRPLTTGPGGEVLERGSLHAEVAVAHHEDLVQDGAVVDEALQHTGRTHVSQAAAAEDQGHLRGRQQLRERGGGGGSRAEGLSDPPRGTASRAPPWSYKLWSTEETRGV